MEVYCQLCGVSSNVGRIRARNEPRTASWSRFGHPKGPVEDAWRLTTSFTEVDPWTDPPSEQCTDCWFVKRPPSSSEDDLEDDPEPEAPRQTCEQSVEANKQEEADHGASLDLQEKFLRLFYSPAEIGEYCAPEFCEHIAGPNCVSTNGYNGNYISAEEMQGCMTIQALAPRQEDWEPEPDDDPDVDGHPDAQYTLTGLIDAAYDVGFAETLIVPHRHGLKDIRLGNFPVHSDDKGKMSLPFHPACLEVFKRASIKRHGRVDTRGLTDWLRLDVYFEYEFPRSSPHVDCDPEQEWPHIRGYEWLAASPLFIQALDAILEDAKRPLTVAGRSRQQPGGNTHDIFLRLSGELRLEVLQYMDFKEVPNLCAASAAFLHPSQRFFRQLLRIHMPWLWEAWCDRPYSFWAGLNGTQVRQKLSIAMRSLHRGNDIDGINGERSLEMGIDNSEHHATTEAQNDTGQNQTGTSSSSGNHNEVATGVAGENGEQGSGETSRHPAQDRCFRTAWKEMSQNRPAPLLPPESTDWARLYLDIATHWDSLLGLRNRERIWNDCNHILDRIAEHRRRGRMGPIGEPFEVDAQARWQEIQDKRLARDEAHMFSHMKDGQRTNEQLDG